MSASDTPLTLRPLLKQRLSPDEPFTLDRAPFHSDVTVGNFWAWALSDLQDNTNRGTLAEYLVATALGVSLRVRESWANWDIETDDGIRVEVKASGFLQSWPQSRLSQIRFGNLTGRTWDPETGAFSEMRSLRADVYVFAVQMVEQHETFDPLDLDQWRFWVASREAMSSLNTRSVSLTAVRRVALADVTFRGLAEAIRQCPGSPRPPASAGSIDSQRQ